MTRPGGRGHAELARKSARLRRTGCGRLSSGRERLAGHWPGPCGAARTTGSRPIGFLDDAFGLTRAAGLPVYRPIQALPEVARAHRAEACVVAIPSLPAPRLAEIVDTARTCGLLVRYLPSFLAAVERDARISDLRQLRVESLLGRRELHVVSEKAATLISGQRVLVTGAGGSIGSELCRQIQGFGPAAALPP